MRLLVFDTETTGLPKSRKSAYEGPNNWPHIVSISWVILDNNVIVKQASHIIKPRNWIVPAEATAIHGISHAKAEEGELLCDILYEFMSENCDAIVAHNLKFDVNVMVNAFKWDLDIPFTGFTVPLLCSMEKSSNLCKIPFPNGNGYKYPKLKELYYHIFRRYPDEQRLHTSIYDVIVLSECIQHSSDLRKAMGI